MERAVQLMETCPDSALACLDSLSVSIAECSEETQMYHLLLTIKAKDKLYIPATSDTLINRVVSFYEDKRDNACLMEAYYYKGSVYRDMKDAPRAVAAFQRAAEIGKDCANDTLNGRIYGQLASLFAFQGLYAESMKASQEAYKYNSACHNYKGIAFCLRDMARIYDMNNQQDSAEIFYREAYTLMKEKISPEKACGIREEMAGFYYNWGKIDSAEVMARQVQSSHPSSLSQLVLGEVYYQKQMFDSASVYLQKVISGNSLCHQRAAYRLLHLVAGKQNQYQKAYQHASFCINALDSISQITQTEEVGKIHSLYNYNLSEQENQRLQAKTERQIALLTEQFEKAKLENDSFKHAMLEAQAKALGATNDQIRAISQRTRDAFACSSSFGHLSSFPSRHQKFRTKRKRLETIRRSTQCGLSKLSAPSVCALSQVIRTRTTYLLFN